MTAYQRDPDDIREVYAAKLRSLAPWSGGVVVILVLVQNPITEWQYVFPNCS